MNILIVSPFDLVVRRFWGPTVRLHALAKEFKRNGHNVLLAGPPPYKEPMPSAFEGVELYYLPIHTFRYGYEDKDVIREAKEMAILGKFTAYPRILTIRTLSLVRLIKTHKINVILANGPFPDVAYPCYVASKITNARFFFDWDDLTGMHGFSTMSKDPIMYQVVSTANELFLARSAKATIVASKYLEEFALSIGVQRERLFYAPSVADIDRYRPDVDSEMIKARHKLWGKKVLLYVGNLHDNNGVKVENVLYTLKLLLEKDRSYFLMVVGGGNLLEDKGKPGKLIEITKELRLEESVIFTGTVPYKEVPMYMASADICLALFPINVVTFTKSPLKVYEYMASGKVVVARDVGDLPFCIKDMETGILVYSDDPVEYAEKILKCFGNKSLLKQIGQNARKIIEERFTWRQSADTIEKAFYQDMVY